MTARVAWYNIQTNQGKGESAVRLRTYNDAIMRVYLIVILVMMAVCLVCLLGLGILELTVPKPPVTAPELPEDEPFEEYPVLDPNEPSEPTSSVKPHERVLGETADAGEKYIDRMVFVGESTTAHLRSRGVLRGGTQTEQVWSNASNTMTLDLNILQKTVRYPVSGVEMTIPEAAAIAKPEMLVLSFGMNGIYGFAKNLDLYSVAYGKLIDAIHTASPDTVVILQTVYPVATNQTTFQDGAATVNEYAARLNGKLTDIAAAHDAYVVDTASCLYGAGGMLRADYQSGDGIHLTADAYRAILAYLRTHAYPIG